MQRMRGIFHDCAKLHKLACSVDLPFNYNWKRSAIVKSSMSLFGLGMTVGHHNLIASRLRQ